MVTIMVRISRLGIAACAYLQLRVRRAHLARILAAVRVTLLLQRLQPLLHEGGVHAYAGARQCMCVHVRGPTCAQHAWLDSNASRIQSAFRLSIRVITSF